MNRFRIHAVLCLLTCAGLPLFAAQTDPQSSGDYGRRALAFPTGAQESSVLLLERIAPVEVRVNSTFTYELRLTNLTASEIRDVVIEERVAPGAEITNVDPAPQQRDGQALSWAWASVPPRARLSMRITAVANRLEELIGCATITVQATGCSSTQVVEPKLALLKSAPPDVLQCDPIPLRFRVTNTGTGVAESVQIRDSLPEGWTTTDGNNRLLFNAGDLAAGESREFSVVAQVDQTGTFTNRAEAVAAGGLRAESSVEIRVRAPRLVVDKTGPSYRFVGRPAEFRIRVSNEGDAAAESTVLTDPLPAGFELISASDQGRLERGAVTWTLGSIEPGNSRTVTLTLRAQELGGMENTATARARCAEGSGSAAMDVRGVPAVLLECVDIEDPDEIGTTETYVITVKNQGSAEDTNIRVQCEVQPEAEYVSSEGPTRATVNQRAVTFAPLPSLAPMATATFRVTVRSLQEGDTRFRVTLDTDQTDSPVTETESTRFYR